MKVLIGCECSGIIREEFNKLGFDAWSCDLQETEIPGKHIKDDLFNVIYEDWDLAILHPECKYLCFSGERWITERPGRNKLREDAFEFFMKCVNAPVQFVCVENSHSIFLNREFRKPDQNIQPYHFGEPFKKMTCLWLKNLPPLQPTNILPIGHRYPAVWLEGPGNDRSKNRARTYKGISKAMAEQWGAFITERHLLSSDHPP